MKMKNKLTLSAILFALLLVFSNNVNAQFNNVVLQIGAGIVEPMGDLKGTYYQDNLFRNYSLFSVNKDFMTNNFGAKTGFGLFGKGKINFDKFNFYLCYQTFPVSQLEYLNCFAPNLQFYFFL